MPGFIGFPELMLLALVVLLVFGPKRLPEMGRSLGKGMREFKDSVTGDNKDEDKEAAPAVLIAPASSSVEQPVIEAPSTNGHHTHTAV